MRFWTTSQNIGRLIGKLSYLCLFQQLVSCATPKVIVSSDKKSTVSLVGFSDFTSDGQILGEAPQTVELDKLKTKFLKVWGKGLAPQYWVFGDIVGRETKLSLKMEETVSDDEDKKPEPKPKDENKDGKGDDENADPNLGYRILMQSYHALSVGDLELARDLANKLKELNAKIASPHILIGITYLQQGAKSEAASAFEIAKSLDPKDAEIERLIQATR